MKYQKNLYNQEIIPQSDIKHSKYDDRMYQQIDGAWKPIDKKKIVNISTIRDTLNIAEELRIKYKYSENDIEINFYERLTSLMELAPTMDNMNILFELVLEIIEKTSNVTRD